MNKEFLQWARETLDEKIKESRKDDLLEEAIKLTRLYKQVEDASYVPSMWTTDTIMIVDHNWQPEQYIRSLNYA